MPSDLTTAEQAAFDRFAEKCFTAGGPRAGFTLRRRAIEWTAGGGPDVDLDAGLTGLVERGLLKRNEKGDFFYLTAAGVEALGGGAA